ncbi:hypothetical protein Tco_1042315 [Tanacetum coccineum]|uniref:Uncharacterized protein n=1 Tax=Tanacetum coccineum TaxID=301880 RepID=A0ABQ5GIR7_9ASTR
MKIQAGEQVSRLGELRRHLQLWKCFRRLYFVVIVLVRNIISNSGVIFKVLQILEKVSPLLKVDRDAVKRRSKMDMKFEHKFDTHQSSNDSIGEIYLGYLGEIYIGYSGKIYLGDSGEIYIVSKGEIYLAIQAKYTLFLRAKYTGFTFRGFSKGEIYIVRNHGESLVDDSTSSYVSNANENNESYINDRHENLNEMLHDLEANDGDINQRYSSQQIHFSESPSHHIESMSFKWLIRYKKQGYIGGLHSVMSSDSAVTYTSVHSEARSWSIPSEDPYEEAARQLLEQAPRPSEYVPDPMELEDHVPVYIPEPEHPEDLVPAEDEAPIEPYITEVASAPTPPLPPPSGGGS